MNSADMIFTIPSMMVETWSNDFDLFKETKSGYQIGFEHQGGTNHFQLKYIVNHISRLFIYVNGQEHLFRSRYIDL